MIPRKYFDSKCRPDDITRQKQNNISAKLPSYDSGPVP